jgi:hypothetical protein
MLTVLLLLSLSSAPSSPAKPEGAGSSKLAPFFLQSDRVQIFVADMPRLPMSEDDEEAEEDAKLPRIGGFVLKSKGIELSAQDREAIAKTWLAPEKVPPREPTLCAFNPDIALRFWRGKSWVDVVVCLGCSEDVFYNDKGQWLDGGSFEDFTLLSKIAKKTFPKEEFGH